MTSTLGGFDFSSTQAYKRFRWDQLNWESVSSDLNLLEQLDWSRINLKKAAAGAGFSINLVKWDQINQSANAATSAYKTFNWATVDWSQASPETTTALNWGRINLKKASAAKAFTINLVDWSEVNSSSAATSAYKTFNWATVDPASLTKTTLENVAWEKVNWKKLPKNSNLAQTVEEEIDRDVNGDKKIGAEPAPTNTPQSNQPNTASPENYYTTTSGKYTYSDSRGKVDNYETNSKILYYFSSAGLPKLIVENENIRFEANNFTSTCINYYYIIYSTNSASIIKFSADNLNKAPEVNRVSSIAYSTNGDTVALETLYLSSSQAGLLVSGGFARFKEETSLSSSPESYSYRNQSISTDPLLTQIDAALSNATKSGTSSNQTWSFNQPSLEGNLTIKSSDNQIQASTEINVNLDSLQGKIIHSYAANAYVNSPIKLINWLINDTILYQGEPAYNDNSSGLNFYDSTQLLTTGLPSSPNQRTTSISDSITNEYFDSRGRITYDLDSITGLITKSEYTYSAEYAEGFKSFGSETYSGTAASTNAIRSSSTFNPGEQGYVTTGSLLESVQAYLPLLEKISWGGEFSLFKQNLNADLSAVGQGS